MSPEQWRQVERLFHSAGALPTSARDACLRLNCGTAEIRLEVEKLLANASTADSFLERPGLEGPGIETASVTLRDSESLLGRDVGPFRIISRLGAGGMGEVYRGHDTKLRRDVAIKTLPAEFVRDPERLARLRREARALAVGEPSEHSRHLRAGTDPRGRLPGHGTG